jgi:PAS domain S-box-containing protein
MARVIRFPRNVTAKATSSGAAVLETPEHRSHLVQFYEDEETLVRAASRFIGGGLRAGDRVCVFATAGHWQAFVDELDASAVDCALLGGQLVFVDARAALAEIFVDGAIDPLRFKARVAPALRPSEKGQHVRIYGEMVDILWREGRSDAALRLEELWSEAAEVQPFTLLCAYVMGNFHRSDGRACLAEVCARHSHVLPAEIADDLGDLRERAHALESEIVQRERLEHALRAAIVEREAARAEAFAERTRLADVLKEAPVAVAVVRADDRRIEVANTRCEHLLGRANLAGRHLSEAFPELAEGEPARIVEQVLVTGEPFRHEGIALRLGGKELALALHAVALRNGAGAIDTAIVVLVDVSEQMRMRWHAARASAASEERFKLLVASVREYAIFMLDPQGYISTWNEGARRIKGYEADEIIGRHFSCFYPAEVARSGKCEHELGVATAEGRFEEEGIRLRKDGTQFWANVVITALRDEHGTLLGFAKVTRDLTEKRRAELERRRLEEAQDASRAKDRFLATVSHELRTPLNAILGYAVLLAEQPLAPDVRRALQVIERNARMQARLIDDVLDVSRIVSGTLRLNVQSAIAQEVVEVAVDTVRPIAQAKGVSLNVHPQAAPISLHADPERLQQVVWNLVTNAVKFTPEGGNVDIDVALEGANLHLVVRDNGRGISPDFLPFLFEPFQQAESTSARRAAGLGLGLSIVKHLVQAHGGTIEAKSEGEGRGATFSVKIPAGRETFDRPRVLAATATHGAADTRLDGVRVLVVDDDEDTRNLIGHILRSAGAEVRIAASAGEAMEAVRVKRPDVLVSDIGMPEVDGFTFVRKLRALSQEHGGRIPAVALTAYARVEDEQRAYGAGYQAYAAKPIDPAHLVLLVASLALVA